jgi:hypothetical protein
MMKVGITARTTLLALGGALLSVIPSFRLLSAQVGHDPATSPYHDIPLRAGPVLFVGHLSNDRGRTGAGMSNALTVGTRYELPAGQSLVIQFTTAYLKGDRFILDPRADSTSPARRTGPVDSDVLLTEFAMQLRLTGGKTWRGLTPYVGAGLGLAFDVNSPGDTTGSGYQFGTKLTLSGSTGVRWYPSQRLMVNLDVRGQAWRLRYPVSFHTPAADGSRIVSLTQPLTDWTLHPWISLGVGWTF